MPTAEERARIEAKIRAEIHAAAAKAAADAPRATPEQRERIAAIFTAARRRRERQGQ